MNICSGAHVHTVLWCVHLAYIHCTLVSFPNILRFYFWLQMFIPPGFTSDVYTTAHLGKAPVLSLLVFSNPPSFSSPLLSLLSASYSHTFLVLFSSSFSGSVWCWGSPAVQSHLQPITHITPLSDLFQTIGNFDFRYRLTLAIHSSHPESQTRFRQLPTLTSNLFQTHQTHFRQWVTLTSDKLWLILADSLSLISVSDVIVI